MPANNFPNVILSKGKIKTKQIFSKSGSLSASTQPLNEQVISNHGDIIALEFVLRTTVTGKLTNAKTMDHAIEQLQLKDKTGRFIMSKIRGIDLYMLERILNLGNTKTIPVASSSQKEERFVIPINIERKDQFATLQTNIAPFSALADSGATGGTYTLEVSAWYVDQSDLGSTQRISRFTQSMGAGDNVVTPFLPKNVLVTALLFKVGTETNLDFINFSSDGTLELDSVQPSRYVGLDNARLTGKHVTGEFDLYVTPFLSTDNTQYSIQANAVDVVEHFVVSQDLND